MLAVPGANGTPETETGETTATATDVPDTTTADTTETTTDDAPEGTKTPDCPPKDQPAPTCGDDWE
ncbi:hypothetical protein [Halorussus salinisoli]|uniref:hypothetical protein n=1 Tax=Halorussus salinisoli TaxID=2558242 RepID=UPI0010C1AD78|nr:hypothetical protein [Halorussus salinisoli]